MVGRGSADCNLGCFYWTLNRKRNSIAFSCANLIVFWKYTKHWQANSRALPWQLCITRVYQALLGQCQALQEQNQSVQGITMANARENPGHYHGNTMALPRHGALPRHYQGNKGITRAITGKTQGITRAIPSISRAKPGHFHGNQALPGYTSHY